MVSNFNAAKDKRTTQKSYFLLRSSKRLNWGKKADVAQLARAADL